jgi:CBS domain-containing protein
VDQPINSPTEKPTLLADRKLLIARTQVADVITQDILTMLPKQNFATVELMTNHSFRHRMVVDADERLLGVISDRDVLRALSRTPVSSKKSVSDIMTRDSIATTPIARFPPQCADAR